MREYARSKGWWDGKSQFNFAAVYSYMTPAKIEEAGSRYHEGKTLLDRSNGQPLHCVDTEVMEMLWEFDFFLSFVLFLWSKGHITAETMMDILRDKDSGINMEGMFMTTGSMVSVIPRDPSLPGVHYFTATPDPDRYCSLPVT